MEKNTEYLVGTCTTCGEECDMSTTDWYHIIPDHDTSHGSHDRETGECLNCPVPTHCGDLKLSLVKTLDNIKSKL